MNCFILFQLAPHIVVDAAIAASMSSTRNHTEYANLLLRGVFKDKASLQRLNRMEPKEGGIRTEVMEDAFKDDAKRKQQCKFIIFFLNNGISLILTKICFLFPVIFKAWLKTHKNEKGEDLYQKQEIQAYVEEFPRQLSRKSTDLLPRGVNLAVLRARQEGRDVKEAREEYCRARAAERAAKRASQGEGGAAASPLKEKRTYTKRGTPGTVLQRRPRKPKCGRPVVSNPFAAVAERAENTHGGLVDLGQGSTIEKCQTQGSGSTDIQLSPQRPVFAELQVANWQGYAGLASAIPAERLETSVPPGQQGSTGFMPYFTN